MPLYNALSVGTDDLLISELLLMSSPLNSLKKLILILLLCHPNKKKSFSPSVLSNPFSLFQVADERCGNASGLGAGYI